MRNRKSGFTLVELIITLVIFAMIVGMISAMITLIVLGVKGCNVIQEKGLKNVAEEIWEGKEQPTNHAPVVDTIDTAPTNNP